ncbi:MAG: hypothetical protein JKY93_02170 [Gammaproteobacteria bacterium]|nr:hypothetical protein [Gammaproteobacteria bacterium]
MNYLSNYIEDSQTELFNQVDAFFAYSPKQFNEAKTEGVTYVSLDSGLIVKKDNVQLLLDGLDQIHQKGITQDIAENGINAIIRRELYNHEAFYTGNIASTAESLEGYGCTKKQIYDRYEFIASTENVDEH